MKKKILWAGIITVCVLLLLGGLYFLKGPQQSFSSLKKKKPYNYILITVDTLRADRIGCYGFSEVDTPTMDLFASRGIKFERCMSQTPLTLPSHTSLLTGTSPTFHGVRDNGGFIVPPELETLAEIFQKQDYQTAAFVAAYVLDSKWGLDQGFDRYFDEFDLSQFKTISLGDVQRRGDKVIDETIHWIEGNRNKKFFTWVHLFDPHTPYEPPSPFKEQYSGRPYIGEIAYTDSQLGRLWEYLKEKDLVQNTILIFASDHGESLGEHQESTHGFFIYQEAIHVPLIFVTPFKKLFGLSRSAVVNLMDVMPTVLEMADLPVPQKVQGQNLIPTFFKDNPEQNSLAYSETYYPRFHYGWSELKGVQDERFKLIIAPQLELYDLKQDPEERHNLIDSHPAEARRLKKMADDFIRRSSEDAFRMDYKNLDEEARQKLAALGYIGSFTDLSRLEGKKLASPKDKIGVFNQLSRAREMGLQGDFEKAVQMIKEIIQEDPEIVNAYFSLGNLYFREHKYEQAIQYFKKALDRKPGDTFTIINIANSQIRLGKWDEAEKLITDSLEVVPPDSQLYLLLGNINRLQKDYPQAIQYYQKCLEKNPSSASAYSNLGAIYIAQDKLEEAQKKLDKALELNPQLVNLHFNYAQIHEKRGRLERAAVEYTKELEYNTHHFRACFNLSRIYRHQRETDKEKEYLEKTMEMNPNFPLSYFYLARIYLK
ncbi:sulfatase-like hydrolase/transferase, partial [bacterium]|nr:sulfatase-like hydrolase/transferase [bacterium]